MLALYTTGWKNKSGTGSRPSCRCGSWKNHWLNYSGSRFWPTNCCVSGCYNRAEDGGHVTNSYYQGEWILPLCREHNNPNNTASFSIKLGSYVAPANRANTCGL